MASPTNTVDVTGASVDGSLPAVTESSADDSNQEHISEIASRRSARPRHPPSYLEDYDISSDQFIEQQASPEQPIEAVVKVTRRESECGSRHSGKSRHSYHSISSIHGSFVSVLSDKQLTVMKREHCKLRLEDIKMRQEEEMIASREMDRLDEEALEAQRKARKVLKQREKIQSDLSRSRELRNAENELKEAQLLESMVSEDNVDPSESLTELTTGLKVPLLSQQAPVITQKPATSRTVPTKPEKRLDPDSVPFAPKSTHTNRHSERMPNVPSAGELVQPNLAELLISSSFGIPRPSLPNFTSERERDFSQLKLALANFVDVHPHLTEQYKYQILMDHLGNKAKTLAQAYMHHSEPYSSAIRALNEKYGQSRQLVQGEINSILSLPFVRPGDHEALDTFNLSVQALIGMLKSLEGEDSVELMCGSHVDKLLAKLPPGLRSNFVEYCINREIIQDDKNTTYNLVQFSQWLNMKSRASRIAAQSVPSRSTESEARPISEPYRRNQRKPYRENAVYTCSTDFQRTNPNSDRFGKNATYKGYCAFCNSDQHHLSSCEKFRELSTDDVVKWIKTKRRCWKCGRSHQASDCNLKKTCRICQKLHLTILHEAVQKATSNVYSLTHEPLYLDQPCQTQNVMLKVVPVILHGEDGSSIDTHAVLDDGSMRTMLLTPALNALDVKSEPDSILLTTIRNEPFQCEGYSVNLSVSPSSDPATRHPLNQVFVSDQLDLSEYNYPVRRLQETYEHLRHIQLPDIQHVKPLILIGSDNSHLILPQEPINFGPVDAPVAVRTKLGWTLQGSTDLTPNHRTERSFLTATQNPASQIMKDVERLWKVDVIPFARNQVVRSKNDNLALEILDSKTVEIKVNDETHYAAPLLRKPNDVVLQAGKESVLRNFKRTVRRLNSDPKGAEIYRKKIQELVDKGFVKKITEEEATSTPESWFIPHHMVEQHGKYRLVFNCSHEYQGIALNNHLLPGPTLGSTLLGVLLRFRQYAIAVSGDIQAMFHQVRLHPEDSSLLRFLWQDPATEDAPEIYEWQVLPFGTTCSPCCAIYVLQRLSASHRETFPDVHKSVMESFYVDNCLESTENESKAQSLILEVREVLAAGGFNMRQWNSNVSNVVKDLPPEARSEQCELWLSQDNGDPHEATLGLKWNCSSDKLMYKCRPITYSKLTMKVVYRIMASQYDPIGFLAPFLARAKILVRDLWNKQRNWDEPIEPGNLFDRWQEWEAELGAMEQISLSRCYSGDLNPMHVTRQLHIFCDASEKIYGSVAYLRTESDTDLSVSFVTARSRVAPKKCLSIPRLELCAALTGAQLCDVLTQELTFPIGSVHMWSDSTTVLCWLQSDSCRYKVFVGTRIAEIQRLSETHTWRFVPTKDNPADDITRGLPLKDLSMPCRWKLGPQFLSEPPQQWPRLDQPKSIEVVSELKQTVCHAITVSQVKFTDWESLLDSTVQSLDGAANMSDVCKFKEAEMKILRQAQRESFPAEVDALSTGKSIPSNSRLKQLSPEYDPEAQIIRVGGRLRQSSDLDLDTKHPIVLDPHHWITCLLIKRHDNLLHHYGPERLFAELRRKYWILRGREAVRKHQRECLECNRWRANPDIPKMADFPKARLRLYKPPFYSCGVDCFGPMHVKIGRRRKKRFGLIFKCLTTRAVHLDLLESMDTDAFLMALRRFIARRGQPHEILSDCGTNFKGGQRELAEAFESMNTDIAKKLARQQIHFRFNPPYAPHFGGTWEREIKSVKHGLRAVLGDESVPELVLLTILIEVESILNSKPLGYVSSDIADPDPVTPNSLLLGRADTSTPQVVYPSTERLSKKRWRQSQVIADQFWKNFVRNYLPSLQLRNKWFKEGRDICEGDTVMIVEPQQIRSSWQIGQVVRAFRSPDGRVRSAEVRTSCGAQTRPVARLVKLPEIDND